MKPRIPKVVHLSESLTPVTFEAHTDHVVAIFQIDNSTIGMRFTSPEQILEFFYNLIEKAVLVWPNNEWIKEYLAKD